MTYSIQLPPAAPRFTSALSVNDEIPTVTLVGEADIAALDLLRATLAAAEAVRSGGDVHVDVGGLTFIGATVIDCLVDADGRLRAHGRRLYVINASQRLARLLAILQLHSLIGAAS